MKCGGSKQAEKMSSKTFSFDVGIFLEVQTCEHAWILLVIYLIYQRPKNRIDGQKHKSIIPLPHNDVKKAYVGAKNGDKVVLYGKSDDKDPTRVQRREVVEGRKFSQNMTRHMRKTVTMCKHAVEGSEKCHLTRHMRTHMGDKPYTCEECDRKFSQKRPIDISTVIRKRPTSLL